MNRINNILTHWLEGIPIENTTSCNSQTAVHSDVEMPGAANKQPNSAITRAVRDIAGEADKVEFEFESNDQLDSCQEQSANGVQSLAQEL
eukprot:2157122-Ditylum_brightwellii.AAC.1